MCTHPSKAHLGELRVTLRPKILNDLCRKEKSMSWSELEQGIRASEIINCPIMRRISVQIQGADEGAYH
jgi:hypothetical protein